MAHSDYAPQLATLVKAPPSGDEWFHEIKYDGYRIGCRIRNGRVTLTTRNGNDWTRTFPEITDAARELAVADALLDGEVAVLLPDGRTSFQALQNAASGESPRAALVYFVFDLLRLDGERLEALPLQERKARLKALLERRPVEQIRYAEHVVGRGERFFEQACRAGLEGIVSKRRDLAYSAGRHGGWVKTKCILRQELVIGGFTDPEGARAGIGALLVGYYEAGKLVFSGKVGTGFTHKGALDLRRQLDAIEQKTCPFDPPPAGSLARVAHWVSPTLVCEVEFTEWTGDGKIRHPSFQGLRFDKPPKEVTHERPQRMAAAISKPAAKATRGSSRTKRAASAAPARVDASVVAGVKISHPDRHLWPDPPITKLDLARFYESIADWIVPHVEGRALTLVRCPQGLAGECFFMKYSKVWAPAPLERVNIQEKTKIGEYLVATDVSGVIALVQMDVLEIHTWNSTVRDVERPDRMVIDLDPGDRVGWPRVVEAARVVRRALEALDLESFVKTTGGRGLHVVVPLVPHADWSQCLDFSRALSEALERSAPEAYTTQFAKAGRGNKILIDYLRNNRTNTSIAAFSTRARPGAPVSTPLTWTELSPAIAPDRFTLKTVPQRMRSLRADPWKGYRTSRQKLTAQRLKAVATFESHR
jgi:bifunctional non-homologous end joining protein LigD